MSVVGRGGPAPCWLLGRRSWREDKSPPALPVKGVAPPASSLSSRGAQTLGEAADYSMQADKYYQLQGPLFVFLNGKNFNILARIIFRTLYNGQLR